MGKQYNKILKRRRRKAYLSRKKAQGESVVKKSTPAKKAAPAKKLKKHQLKKQPQRRKRSNSHTTIEFMKPVSTHLRETGFFNA